MNRASEYLSQNVTAFRKLWELNGHTMPDRRFFNYEELVLTLGEEMTGSPLPEGIRRGRMKHCYENARSLCESVDWTLDYYEGYAIHSFMAVPHAWAVDPTDGLVLDNTWDEPEKADYIGVRIDAEVVYAQMVRTQHNSVFDSDWMAQGYMLTEGWKELSCASELASAPDTK